MRGKFPIVLHLLSFILLLSCSKDDDIVPSLTITSVDHDIVGYNRIDIQDTFKTKVHFTNDEETVRVEANENLHEYIIVEKDMETLIIRMKDKVNLEGQTATLNAYINTDHIFHYTGSGAVSIELMDTISAGEFQLHLSGASTISGTFLGGDVNAVISGASALYLLGTSNKFTLDATGACTVEGFGFATDWLYADLAGASNVSLTVNNKLDVWAEGASTVYYKGEGVINTQELTGGSQIIKVN